MFLCLNRYHLLKLFNRFLWCLPFKNILPSYISLVFWILMIVFTLKWIWKTKFSLVMEYEYKWVQVWLLEWCCALAGWLYFSLRVIVKEELHLFIMCKIVMYENNRIPYSFIYSNLHLFVSYGSLLNKWLDIMGRLYMFGCVSMLVEESNNRCFRQIPRRRLLQTPGKVPMFGN